MGLTMKAVIALAVLVALAQSEDCPEPAIAECAVDTDITCDMGSYAGCSYGTFCMPEGSICPPVCDMPAPSECAEGEMICDNGSDGGCWLGDSCMPEGSECPVACHNPPPAECMEGETVCDMGMSPRAAGGETTACLRERSVLLLPKPSSF